MQLLNNFYTRSNWHQEGESLSCTIAFNSDHEIFKGHFPQHPVVPGVCTMTIIKDALQEALGQKLTLHTAGAVKFLQLITPDHSVAVNVKWSTTTEGISAQASLSNEGRPVFKMNATYNKQGS